MTGTALSQENDPYLWLENIDDPKSLEWVNTMNEKSLSEFNARPYYKENYEKILQVLNSTDRIAAPEIYGNYIYNFWQDKVNPRGIWRRTATDQYLAGTPVWETLIDIDKLSEKENIKWVFKGGTGLYPEFNRFLVSLSKGGGDAVEIREFDAITKSFVENGFFLPEAKGGASWIDINTLMVSTDFGDGMTTSGYPKKVKIWKRGTELRDATLVFEGKESDMGTWGNTFMTKERAYQLIINSTSFYSANHYVIENGKLIKLDLPKDVSLSSVFKGQVILQLKSDWNVGGKNFKQGSVLSIKYDDLLAGKTNYLLLVEPDNRSSVEGMAITDNMLLINMLNNVKSELHAYSWNGNWDKTKINAPEYGNITLGATDENSDNYFFLFTNFLSPSTLYYGNSKTGSIQKVKSLPEWFATDKFQVQQYEAVSKDGTNIPYFVVGQKGMKSDGTNPTLLYAYGGFEVSQLPSYSAITGMMWLEKGGVYVLANLRGGGEFGPKWHQAGLKENRQRIYDDFHGVAEDLIKRKITSPEKIGIFGGSNGGLLVGVGFTQRPDLYKAVVCAVPLLDMKRYNKLLAGASWMAEYGNPDIPEEWNYIGRYSPYHNLKPGVKYPEVFFTTSTRDDRVHPGHARKTAAKLVELGNKVYYFENTEGGHGGASTNEQRARMSAQIYTYLRMKLME
jgi:prolyl oligopeptidase